MWLYLPEGFNTSVSAPETPASIWVSMQRYPAWAEALAASCTWKGKSLPSRSWLRESRKGFLGTLPYGAISPPVTSPDGEVRWTDSLPECHASLSPKQAASWATRTTDGSGHTSCASCAKAAAGSSSSRTCADCSPHRMGNLYRTSKGTWRPRVSFSKRMWSQQPLWAHLISGTESSSSPSTEAFWKGPRSSENAQSKEQVRRMARGESAWEAANRGATTTTQSQAWPPRKWATTTRDHKDGTNPSLKADTNHLLGRQAPRWPDKNWTSATTTDATMKTENLRAVAKSSLAVGNFRGINLANHIGLWPTTTTQDAAGSRNETATRYSNKPFAKGTTMTDEITLWPRREDSQASSLQERERLISALGQMFSEPDPGSPQPSQRHLNPAFVEWLQGWPENWSDADETVYIASWRSAMVSCLCKLPWHSSGSYGVMSKPSKDTRKKRKRVV